MNASFILLWELDDVCGAPTAAPGTSRCLHPRPLPCDLQPSGAHGISGVGQACPDEKELTQPACESLVSHFSSSMKSHLAACPEPHPKVFWEVEVRPLITWMSDSSAAHTVKSGHHQGLCPCRLHPCPLPVPLWGWLLVTEPRLWYHLLYGHQSHPAFLLVFSSQNFTTHLDNRLEPAPTCPRFPHQKSHIEISRAA